MRSLFQAEFIGLAGGKFYIITPIFTGYTFEPPAHEFPSLSNSYINADFVLSCSTCLSELIYGENSDETALLRYLRDNVLSQTPEGREIIKLYYEWSPAIVKAIEEDEEFRKELKEMIDEIMTFN